MSYSINVYSYRLPALFFWKEGHLPRVLAQAGEAHAQKPYCLLQPNGSKDLLCCAVNLKASLHGVTEGVLPGKGGKICVADGERNRSAKKSAGAHPAAYHFCKLQQICLENVLLKNIPAEGHAVADGLCIRLASQGNHRALIFSPAHPGAELRRQSRTGV